MEQKLKELYELASEVAPLMDNWNTADNTEETVKARMNHLIGFCLALGTKN